MDIGIVYPCRPIFIRGIKLFLFSNPLFSNLILSVRVQQCGHGAGQLSFSSWDVVANSNPTRKRGIHAVPRLRVGLPRVPKLKK